MRRTWTERGLVGDRAYALIDTDTGKVVSAKSVKRFPDLLACRAAFVQPPGADDDLPPVEITLPDGSTVRSDTSDAFWRVVHVLSTRCHPGPGCAGGLHRPVPPRY